MPLSSKKMRFRAENGLAFGVEPNRRAYRLRLARYPAAAETVCDFIEARAEADADSKPIRILDVGVGNGRLMRYVDHLSEYEHVHWTGIDISVSRLKSIYRRDQWELRNADVTDGLPFEASSFDVVYCEQLLEHLENPVFVIHEIKRMLRPRGIAVLGVPTFPPGVAACRWLGAQLASACVDWKSRHVQTFTAAGFARLCESAGLNVRGVRGFRVMSGVLIAPLENRRWFWLANRWFGAKCPALCTEIQLVATNDERSL